MKVLFIGPYRQPDGWGEAASALVHSLMTTDIDLTIRPIFLARNGNTVEEKFLPFEQKANESYDVIIQNSLPEFFRWNPGVINIGFCSTESQHLEYTPWIASMNLMDEIWVHSTHEVRALHQGGCKCVVPIHAIGGATDASKFLKSYDHKPNSNFTFYTIGDGERKNLEALLVAFHREFDKNEPVDLVIKTLENINSLSAKINDLKNSLGIYKNIHQYKKEILITHRLSENELNHLHVNNSCFVMTSYGEAWCRPALDALGFGKTPIVTDNTGMTDFINDGNGWIVPSREIPVRIKNKPLEYLYTAKETWFDIDILALQKIMREAYSNKIIRAQKSANGLKSVTKYSYEAMGTLLLKRLEWATRLLEK